ncbi:MAG: LytR C-terminal domain-containing protein [Acidimicrobiales bacterium]
MARRRPTEPTANPARGAALVVVAVVIGLFLLRNGLDTSEAITSNPGDGEQATDSEPSDGTAGTDDGTTTTTVALRAPAEVPTIVLNDSTTAGVAGTYSDALAAAGYTLTNPDGANADADGDSAVTQVFFLPGFDAEAAAVAVAIGAPATVVPTALPTPPPGPIASASVVVVIGTDLAGVTPTTAVAGAGGTTTTAAT